VNKAPVRALAVNRFVADDELVKWQGLEFRVLATDGYSRDAVTYLAEISGVRIAFAGDLLWSTPPEFHTRGMTVCATKLRSRGSTRPRPTATPAEASGP
jgi:glyoxylase-like metal-dependent hydrolase (beta-lactamase superfamily II)